MAKAMTAARELRDPRVEGHDRAVLATRRGGTMNMPFLLAKNLLFWGSVSLSLYVLYTLVAAL
ncbi:MAG: hypothetical protein JJ866_10755 [Roseibium sp.]|uniref:hypothetical protein n=1 Tax=Roseibium sp. TaxID=1936156 RepID=UPI001B23F9FA|nr:hypothetical protein [Roseibium sp.]MBO6892410.1 hypothetical protein [Roseibium sp.]MBO6928676.1 hypothetical protein [Roseibium sp.]